MGTLAKRLNGTFRKFIEAQPMFFVATAARDGRVNVSPKGMDSLRVISDSRIVWLNMSGSGNETAAHLLDTPRMTLMFCAFEGSARILRVYGQAKAIHPRDDGWEDAIALFPNYAGSRQIFELEIEAVLSSCGTGVPKMDFVSHRGLDELVPHYESLGEDGVEAYWRKKNVVSIDGKPTGLFED